MKSNIIIKVLVFSIILLFPLKVLAQFPFPLPPSPPPSAQQPSAKLIMSKTNLGPGDSLELDLELTSSGSKEPIDIFFSIDMGIISSYMVIDPKSPTGLNFVNRKEPLVSNFQPLNFKVRIFGPSPFIFQPSLFGEIIIPPGLDLTFAFKLELIRSSTKEPISTDRIGVNISSGAPTTTTTVPRGPTTTVPTTTVPTTTVPSGPITIQEVEPNSNASTAQVLGEIKPGNVFLIQGFIGVDDLDVFRFKISSSQNLLINLSFDPSISLVFFIGDPQTAQIIKAFETPKGSFSIEPPPGKSTSIDIGVGSITGVGKYTLQVSSEPITTTPPPTGPTTTVPSAKPITIQEMEPNDTPETAQDIGTIAPGSKLIIQGFTSIPPVISGGKIVDLGDVDGFRAFISSPQQLSITISSPSLPKVLLIGDERGNPIGKNDPKNPSAPVFLTIERPMKIIILVSGLDVGPYILEIHSSP